MVEKIFVAVITVMMLTMSVTPVGSFELKSSELENQSLNLALEIEIVRPGNSLYINDAQLFPLLFFSLIFGPITLRAQASDGVDYVEFYVDGELISLQSSPVSGQTYEYLCDAPLSGMHTFSVRGVGQESSVEDSKKVFAFNDGGSSPVEITEEEALEILFEEVIIPTESNNRNCAFMPDEVLQAGDLVSSVDGSEYPVNEASWFVFVDDMPEAYYAHPVRYVFIEAQSGEVTVYDEQWPPLVNDIDLFDADFELIKCFAVVPNAPEVIEESSIDAPVADFGDAPDGQMAYQGIVGRYPTLFATSNSLFSRPGGHVLNVGLEMLGDTVSSEQDATDPADPDGVPNLVDADKDERVFLIQKDNQVRLATVVTIDDSAPEGARYLNLLIDFNQDGRWKQYASTDEWAVVNDKVILAQGSSEVVLLPWFIWPESADEYASPVWMRLALTRSQIDEALFENDGGWDGSGEFLYGEIEDYFGYLTSTPWEPELWPRYPDNPPDGSNPDPTDPPGVFPPGPQTVCDPPDEVDVDYYAIIISGGDCRSHMARGLHPAQDAVSRMQGLFGEQNISIQATLTADGSGDNQNTVENIESQIADIALQLKCVDRLMIYMVGHGGDFRLGTQTETGFGLYGTNGRVREVLTPAELGDILSSIAPCRDQPCETTGVCCHVTVVLESCHSGNFNVAEVTGDGRTIIGSCQADEVASAVDGGAFTKGFAQGFWDEDLDADDDGFINATEAYSGGLSQMSSTQHPWIDDQQCPCTCPECDPEMNISKLVWDVYGERWLEETYALLGDGVAFKLSMQNTGDCDTLVGMEFIDVLPWCLSYVEGTILYVNGEEVGVREPDVIEETVDGLSLQWYLGEDVPRLLPGDSIELVLRATVVDVGPNINYFLGRAYLHTDPSVIVDGEDTATVWVEG